MVAQPTPSPLTVEEYLALEETSSEKHEYVNGRLYAMAGGTNAHDRIGNNIRALINIHLGAGPCVLHGPDVRLRASPTVYYYPDAFITCEESMDAGTKEFTAARLVVEVLSEGTEGSDRGEKFAAYQALAGLDEYVLIDSRQHVAERYRRSGSDWIYHRYGDGDTLTLDAIALSVPVAALYVASGL